MPGNFTHDEGFLHVFLTPSPSDSKKAAVLETELWLVPLTNVILQIDSRKLIKIFK